MIYLSSEYNQRFEITYIHRSKKGNCMKKKKSLFLLTVKRQYEFFRDRLTGDLYIAKTIHENCLIALTELSFYLSRNDKKEAEHLSNQLLRIYDKLLEIQEILVEDYTKDGFET